MKKVYGTGTTKTKVTHEEGEPSTSTSIITPTSHLTYDDEDEPK
jgi:hypothetical protein